MPLDVDANLLRPAENSPRPFPMSTSEFRLHVEKWCGHLAKSSIHLKRLSLDKQRPLPTQPKMCSTPSRELNSYLQILVGSRFYWHAEKPRLFECSAVETGHTRPQGLCVMLRPHIRKWWISVCTRSLNRHNFSQKVMIPFCLNRSTILRKSLAIYAACLFLCSLRWLGRIPSHRL